MKISDLFGSKAKRLPTPEQITALGNELGDATERSDVPAMAAALKMGAPVDFRHQMDRTSLMIAAEDNQPEAVTLLMEHKACPALVNGFRQTPLHLALRAGADDEIPLSFIDAGCPLNGQDKHGATPAFYAAQTANATVLNAMAAKGADFSTPNDKGMTPLMQAVGLGHTEAALVLMQHDCGLNAREPNGTSALMLAISVRNQRLVEALLDKGADHRQKNLSGESCLDVARRIGLDGKAMALLEKADAAHIEPFRNGSDQSFPVMKKLVLNARPGAAL